MKKINIDYVEKIREGLFRVCVSSNEISVLKYGADYIYEPKSKTIMIDREFSNANVALRAMAVNDIDVIGIFDEAVNNYKEEAITEDKMKNLFIGAIN